MIAQSDCRIRFAPWFQLWFCRWLLSINERTSLGRILAIIMVQFKSKIELLRKRAESGKQTIPFKSITNKPKSPSKGDGGDIISDDKETDVKHEACHDDTTFQSLKENYRKNAPLCIPSLSEDIQTQNGSNQG
ncbi:hypothetical protein H5410_037504 [Solanum commersonii]|uniref:Uncharacterized protein n=1 Tax=Solanum commersonii TaxID=4109 RepID=A0A9J5Y9Q5_SOLCO|nr:hypothetical protein H5410_037504 [Solanum commersonii]